MFKKCICFFIGTITLLSFNNRVFGQNATLLNYGEQIELKHDNDFFLLTDRYYSSGLFLTYRKLLTKGIFTENKEQLDFTLGQEIYTPSQTQSTNSAVFDRSYAGFLGLKTAWSIAGNKQQLFKTSILIGLTGLNSGGGGLQRWYHRIIAIRDSPLWVAELNNSFHLNTYVSYTKEWKLSKNTTKTSFALQSNAAVGSRDIYLEPETVLYLGRRNSIGNSIAYNRLGELNSNELYFALRASYRYVAHNGLIEGNLFGDDSAVLRDTLNSVWRFGIDFYHRFKRNDYKFGLRFNTAENLESSNHKFISLSYGLSF